MELIIIDAICKANLIENKDTVCLVTNFVKKVKEKIQMNSIKIKRHEKVLKMRLHFTCLKM